MKYNTIISGQFVSRPNRFIAQVQVDGAMQTVHVKNTGRCKELLLPPTMAAWVSHVTLPTVRPW